MLRPAVVCQLRQAHSRYGNTHAVLRQGPPVHGGAAVVKLPAWVDFNPVRPDRVELLEWWVEDGREAAVTRLARRYGADRGWMEEQVRFMHRTGLVERRKGWDGWMYRPTEHGKKVAERGW